MQKFTLQLPAFVYIVYSIAKIRLHTCTGPQICSAGKKFTSYKVELKVACVLLNRAGMVTFENVFLKVSGT